MLEPRLILVNLLIKLGVAAALSSALVRSKEFKNLIFREHRETRQKIYLALWMGIPIALGVWIRFSAKSFFAGDLSLETALLLGVIGGRLAGGVGGAMMAVPAALHGEWAVMPLNVFAGIVAGWLRRAAPEQEDIWSFSPFIDLTVYRMIRRNLPRPKVFDWQIAFFVTIVALRFLQTEIWRFWPNSIFSLESPDLWNGGTLNGYLLESAIYLAAVMVVGTELKIFNSVRIQIKLEEQERLLLQARMAALQNQINPHFLFNTLNSISSLVRFDPDTAREMILKLATILRRLLHSSDSFVPLREEIEFIDNYLDIEVVRFGRDKLRVIKDLDPASLEAMVPSMLLQPLVENCIKHGLSPKIEGGSITLRSRVIKSRLVVEVEDDGVGMGSPQPLREFSGDHSHDDGTGGMGIGMANVAERLKVLYDDAAKMMIESREGGGTLVRLRLPILPNAEELMTTSTVAPIPFGKSLRKAE